MPNVHRGTIRWRGDSGTVGANEVTSLVRLIDWADFTSFYTSLPSHSLCNVTAVVRHNITTWDLDPPGTAADVSKKAIIYYRDPNDLKVSFLEYPAPIASDIEMTAVGKRIKAASVATIVGYISTMMGISYVPLYGVYEERV